MTTNDQNTTASKAPTHIAYHMEKGKDGKSYPNRIGVAWAHKTGGGFNIQVHSVPLDGRITLFLPSEKSE